MILAGGAWSGSLATFLVPVAKQRLASDYVAQTKSVGCLTHCHHCCPQLSDQGTVNVTHCYHLDLPLVIAISKRKTVGHRKPCSLSVIWRFHFHHTITDWLEKVAEHDQGCLAFCQCLQ